VRAGTVDARFRRATVVDVVVLVAVLLGAAVVPRVARDGVGAVVAVDAAAPPHDASTHAPAAIHLEVRCTPHCLPTRAGTMVGDSRL
jgi:hypothetical protein